MSDGVKKSRILGEGYVQQFNVLRALSKNGGASRPVHINEIAEQAGLGDEREIQRCLYILEGQKLVTPQPEGDFTSKIWQITKDGVRALHVIQTATVQ